MTERASAAPPEAQSEREAVPPERRPDAEPTREHRNFWRELPVLVVVAFGVAILIKTFLVQPFYIPSESMLPTLRVGDRILVEKVSYRFSEPERGDLVVFERALGGRAPTDRDRSWVDRLGDSVRELFGFPTGGDQDLVKRVVGIEGDRVEGRDGAVYVNGERVAEAYLSEGRATGQFPLTTVGSGEIFVMGDNRPKSDDSRSFGPVPTDEIVGRVFVLIWPPGNVGTL